MILERILAARRRRLEEAKARVPAEAMAREAETAARLRRQRAAERRAFGRPPLESGLRAALEAAEPDRFPVIAEIKRASPSAGAFGAGLRVGALARAYREGGAAAVSVLTEPDFFQARPRDLETAASTSGLPVLRKDFIVDPYQVDEAAVMGAAAVLLIVAALRDDELRRLFARAVELGLDALVEVHDEFELERALAAGARLVGVNNRDLRTFETRLEVTERLARLVPREAFLVTESGIRDPEDIRRLAAAGARAALVGESLVRAADPAAALRALTCATVARGGEAACS
ncbi:MAG: indole-3-glycerol phosphate synthase TrpC [Firmicutes bacterium]|nr:indole-3-glycerol phosphate synthase TrpC [Bacillota bacterium]